MSEPAFPMNRDHHTMFGLTKREWFAATAPHDDLAIPDTVAMCADFLGIDVKDYRWATHWPKVVAKARRIAADALIAELEQQA